MSSHGDDFFPRLEGRKINPEEVYAVGEKPSQEMKPDIYVLAKENLQDGEIDIITYSESLDEAFLLLEEYACSEMAMLAARDPFFPQADVNSSNRYADPAWRNKSGGGLNALSLFEPPFEELEQGDYIIFFEDKARRIEKERRDEDRVYLAHKRHPDEKKEEGDEEGDPIDVLAYYSVFKVSLNLRDFLRTKTEAIDLIAKSECVLANEEEEEDEYQEEEED